MARSKSLAAMLATALLAGCAQKDWQVRSAKTEAPERTPIAAGSAEAPALGAGPDVRSGVGPAFLEFPPRQDAVVARVGAEELTKSQVFDYMRSAYPERVQAAITVMLTNRIVGAEAARHGIAVNGEEIDRWYARHETELVRRAQIEYGQGTTLEQYLARSGGQTPAQYRAAASDRERATRILQRLIRFQEMTEERVELRLISVGERELALDLSKKIVAGADFAGLAKAHSVHPSADKGGLLPLLFRGALNPALDGPAFTMPVGSVSEPIRAEDDGGRERWQIVKVLRRVAGRAVAYAEVEREIIVGLEEKPLSQDEWVIWQLRANRTISIEVGTR